MLERMELWKECVRWMVQCGVLDGRHRVAESDAEIADFAAILRDGVLLCVLCNKLSENCIDTKDLQQRPQMAQFLCCKNICEFLKACQNTFELKAEDLFEPWDLYRLKDFAKVLKTLSKLSHSSQAKLAGIKGFPTRSLSIVSTEYGNDEAIYRNLQDDAEDNEVIIENAYDIEGAEEEEKTSGRIYDTIVCQRSPSQREIKSIDYDKWTSFKPETRREHCIKELYDTESNYVEKALDMIINKFYAPLKGFLSAEDHKLIFINIVELACIHRSFREHLRQAVFYAAGLEVQPTTEKLVTIGDVFITWKEKFVAYGEYCSKLPDSRSRICHLEKSDPHIRQRILECGMEANRNQFHLHDLLSIPMQRVLKYHVLLSEMIKLTSVESTDRLSLEEAREAMQDINVYINEMKRDTEMQQLVLAIERSIPDLEMPEGMHLINYGRLVKDGEIKIAGLSKDGNKLKNRYVFVFDQLMVICKSLRGNQYSFKNALVLNDYQLLMDMESNTKFGTLTRKLTTNGGYYFSLVQNISDGESNVLNMCCKTLGQRDNWLHNIETAQDNVKPKDMEISGHKLLYHSFDKATNCSHCQKLLAGLFYQGYQCRICMKNLHRSCISMNKCSRTVLLQARNSHHHRRHIPILQLNECVRAVQSFHSTDPRFLSFEKGDLIEVTQQNADGIFVGRSIGCADKIGLVHSEFLRKYRPSTSSLHSLSLCSNGFGNESSISPEFGENWQLSPVLPKLSSFLQRKSSTSSDCAMSMKASSSLSQDYVNTDVVSQQWYQGCLERRESENRLRKTPDGTFLVRFSNTQQKYVISISYNDEVKHTKIEQSLDNRFYLDESRMFASVVELVNYYRENNLRESFETLNTTLRHVYMANRLYVAIHNFEATDSNFLGLVVGQKVYVISRNGEDRGWWKGKSGSNIGYFPQAYVEPVEPTNV